jgi:hypothetical protein
LDARWAHCCARRWPGRFEQAAFWQPVLDGKRFLAQFFRLRVAASMMEPNKRESVEALRALLHSSGRIEVAGYELGSKLVGQLDTLALDARCCADIGAIHWMEVLRDHAATLPTPSRQFIDAQRSAGHEDRGTHVRRRAILVFRRDRYEPAADREYCRSPGGAACDESGEPWLSAC